MKMYFILFLQVRGILYNTNLSIVSKGGAIQSHYAVKQNGTDNITGLLNAVHSWKIMLSLSNKEIFIFIVKEVFS